MSRRIIEANLTIKVEKLLPSGRVKVEKFLLPNMVHAVGDKIFKRRYWLRKYGVKENEAEIIQVDEIKQIGETN